MGVVIMITMKKKIVSGSLVVLAALSLAGCANNSATPANKASHPQAAKVAQSSSKKAINSSQAKVVSQSQSSVDQNAAVASTASVSTRASYAAQSNNANQQGTVVNKFIKASGVNGQGMQYMVSQPNEKGNYQVEVRDSNGDPNIAHLDGIYQFNPETNQVQTMNPVTGQYEK